MNFFSGIPKGHRENYKKPRYHCELPPPAGFVPEASHVWGGTTKSYLDKYKSARRWRQPTTVELYDLYKDPFEITNLATAQHISKYHEKIREIRAWAEAEIGRPPKAVVGQWNMAYEKMLRTAYPQQGYKQFIVDSRD